ncbi:MAG: Calx-beta domain-containing protein [Vicinamibacterales bacterium]
MQTRMKWMLVLVAAVIAAACGDSMSSLNPTAPSALSPATLKVEANAADVPAGSMGNGPKPGNANGNGGAGNGNGNGNQQPTPAGKAKVEIEGLIDAVGGGSITVNNQKALVTAATVIRHGNRPVELLALRVKDRVHLRANRIEPTAAGVTLEATEILVQNPGDGEVALPPAPKPLVSVSAYDADAGENGGNPGVVRFARSGDTSSSLTVSFSLTGSATDGVDYESLPTTVMFPEGLATVDVTLTPKTDSLVEGNESATLTVMAGAGYELGSPGSATVNIADHVVPAGPVVTVSASEPQANEEMTLFGVFELRRTGDLSTSLTVTVAFGGTASVDDYQDPGGVTVTFNAYEATATVVVIANQDFQTEGAETVTLTVVDGDGYDPGAPATATVTIPANSL